MTGSLSLWFTENIREISLILSVKLSIKEVIKIQLNFAPESKERHCCLVAGGDFPNCPKEQRHAFKVHTVWKTPNLSASSHDLTKVALFHMCRGSQWGPCYCTHFLKACSLCFIWYFSYPKVTLWLWLRGLEGWLSLVSYVKIKRLFSFFFNA